MSTFAQEAALLRGGQRRELLRLLGALNTPSNFEGAIHSKHPTEQNRGAPQDEASCLHSQRCFRKKHHTLVSFFLS